MRHKLEFQANRIEAVLALNKVEARVTGGTITPRWVHLSSIRKLAQTPVSGVPFALVPGG